MIETVIEEHKAKPVVKARAKPKAKAIVKVIKEEVEPIEEEDEPVVEEKPKKK